MGQNIINLYKQFDKYKYVSNDTIYYKILPSLRLNQYKTDEFDLNRIFNLYDDDDIEYCNRHKIFSSEIAWGMNFSLN